MLNCGGQPEMSIGVDPDYDGFCSIWIGAGL